MKSFVITLLWIVIALLPAPRGQASYFYGAAAASSTLNNNVIAVWNLDESSGTRSATVGGFTLTDNNTVGSATGKFTTAADFIRANTETLSCTDNATLSLGDNDWTISCWVNLDDLNTGGLFRKMNAGNGQLEYALRYDAGGGNIFQFRVQNASGTNGDVLPTSSLNYGAAATGTWYHIVVWHDSVNNLIGIVVNAGTANTTSWTTGVRDTTGDFALGLDYNGTCFDGKIDEVVIWSRVLSSTERTELYNSGTGKAYPY